MNKLISAGRKLPAFTKAAYANFIYFHGQGKSANEISDAIRVKLDVIENAIKALANEKEETDEEETDEEVLTPQQRGAITRAANRAAREE